MKTLLLLFVCGALSGAPADTSNLNSTEKAAIEFFRSFLGGLISRSGDEGLRQTVDNALKMGESLSQASETGTLTGLAKVSCQDSSIVARVNPQVSFQLNLPTGNYSGIAPLPDGSFALIDDKSPTEGFRKVIISFDAKGAITKVSDGGFVQASTLLEGADGEGIAFNTRRGTLFLTRENSNECVEIALSGKATGKSLHTQKHFPVNGNSGLESLTYSPEQDLFFTTSEGVLQGEQMHRIQSYHGHGRMKAASHWGYVMDPPVTTQKGSRYAYGICELCALPDGSLIVMEREENVPGTSTAAAAGAFATIKLYLTDPSSTPKGATLQKKLILRLDNYIMDLSLANYEGLCLGPVLPDGTRVMIMVADSQANYKGVLQDYFRTVTLKL